MCTDKRQDYCFKGQLLDNSCSDAETTEKTPKMMLMIMMVMTSTIPE